MEKTTYTTIFFKINYSSGRVSDLSGTIFSSAEELADGLEKLVEFSTGGIPMRLRASIDSIETNCFVTAEGFPLIVSPEYRLFKYDVRKGEMEVFKNDIEAIFVRYNNYDIDIKKIIFDLKLGSDCQIITVGDDTCELNRAQ